MVFESAWVWVGFHFAIRGTGFLSFSLGGLVLIEMIFCLCMSFVYIPLMTTSTASTLFFHYFENIFSMISESRMIEHIFWCL